MRPQALYAVAVVKVLVNLEKNTFNGVLVSVKLQDHEGRKGIEVTIRKLDSLAEI